MQLLLTFLAAMVIRVVLLTLSVAVIWLTWNHGVVSVFETLPRITFSQCWLCTAFVYFVGDVFRGTLLIKLNQ